MYRRYLVNKPRRTLVLGSGALQIGQAGEFDYSGSQAIKALKEEGIYTVLVNPNIATVQTNQEFADRVYLLAVAPYFVEQVIVKENIDSILLSFGGQTALNCGLALQDSGVLERYSVRVLGSPIKAIRDTEDRHLFVERLKTIDVKTARSKACRSVKEAQQAAQDIGLPIMLRTGFALGGKGSGIVEAEVDLESALIRAFGNGTQQVLVEECLRGWKEIEYEVVRDFRDNCITVCNMENLDPLGIHTGESIVVAPSQTLTDDEYQSLRSIAIRVIRHLGIIGECNIQYALDPFSGDYRVIEVNARLSRSSALASKATGYPLAYVAAKLAIGYTLPEIPNGITGCTTAFFEPALDYIVCKVPRWDLTKFHGASMRIGSEMKSVGEVMAIGRTFPEVIQKALRMLDIGVAGLDPGSFRFEDVRSEIKHPTPLRIFAVAQALHDGISINEIRQLSQIDCWFLACIEEIVLMERRLRSETWPLSKEEMLKAKRLGFSDQSIANFLDVSEDEVRNFRNLHGIRPRIAQIDTMAAEFPASTNYLYFTYHGQQDDIAPTEGKKVMVLGSGPYRIGSSVEFDWCCVESIRAAAKLGFETIVVNCNPETVSTDYDECAKLYFEEVSLENVLAIYEAERPNGVVVSMGGQVPNNLSMRLFEAGVKVLGTSPEDIDRAENRSKFSALLDQLHIDQPRWTNVTDFESAAAAVEAVGGFPVLVRPSYVLSGAAMSIAQEASVLREILARATRMSPKYPVVVSKFETHAREVEIDAVADHGELVLWGICEHIENAGIHSGDATLMLPPQTLYLPTIRRIKEISAALARALSISGPFNIQFLAKHNVVKVIECNLRASRSFPFVSKVIGENFAAEGMRRMLGYRRRVRAESLDLGYVGVKAPMFSFSRLVGADALLGVEMSSTGEVACLGNDFHEALLHALNATGFLFPNKGVLLSLGPTEDKYWFAEEIRVIAGQLNLPIYATRGTAGMITDLGFECVVVEKEPGTANSAMEVIRTSQVDLVINIPREYDELGRPDGYLIRRCAVEMGVPLVTDLQLARSLIEALRCKKLDQLPIVAWNDYLDDAVRDPVS